MYQDFSLYEIVIWNATAHDPYSTESIARRMLALEATDYSVAALLGLDLAYVQELDKQDNKMFMDLSGGITQIYSKIVDLKERHRSLNNTYPFGLFNDSLSIDSGFAKILGMTESQFQIYSERFIDK